MMKAAENGERFDGSVQLNDAGNGRIRVQRPRSAERIVILRTLACNRRRRISCTMTELSYSSYRFPAEIIRQTIWIYLSFPLSFRDVENLVHIEN
jgi:hypothetical protein